MPVVIVQTKRFSDGRGWFAETYNRERLSKLGIAIDFVQDNHSMSRDRGVVRGLHFQAPPHAQAKLIRCVRGGIWDVAVDIRVGSPTFAQWVACELTAGNGIQTFVPIGFAHGFVTLEPDTEVEYKTSDFYAPECEGGVIWNDPELKLPWPLSGAAPVLSEKDLGLGTLAKLKSPFEYDGRPLAPLDS